MLKHHIDELSCQFFADTNEHSHAEDNIKLLISEISFQIRNIGADQVHFGPRVAEDRTSLRDCMRIDVEADQALCRRKQLCLHIAEEVARCATDIAHTLDVFLRIEVANFQLLNNIVEDHPVGGQEPARIEWVRFLVLLRRPDMIGPNEAMKSFRVTLGNIADERRRPPVPCRYPGLTIHPDGKTFPSLER